MSIVDYRNNISFREIDQVLSKKYKIIHQIYFDFNAASRKNFQTQFAKFRHSWIERNPEWFYIVWNKQQCRDFIKTYYPEFIITYDSYKYEIQRCDIVRYFLLFHYGGFYVDIDLECVTTADEIRKQFPAPLYLAETPNKAAGTEVSNFLMYSQKHHPFWRDLFLYIPQYAEQFWFVTRHVHIMYSTGPAFLNKMYSRHRFKYNISQFPADLFNPLMLGMDKVGFNRNNLHTIHWGSGSWETKDSHILIFFYTHWKILLFVCAGLLAPLIIYRLMSMIEQ